MFSLAPILMVACAGGAPTQAPSPTVDLEATIAAAVDATRSYERAVEATADVEMEATRVATPTATPVVMTIYAPTPEPFVASPGSMEQGIEEMRRCLRESKEFRAFFVASIELEGWSRDSADDLSRALIEDKDLFVEAMLGAAEEDAAYASMSSILGGMAGEACGSPASGVTNDLGMGVGEARLLVEEFYDCLGSDEGTGEYFLSMVGEVEKSVFVDVFLLSMREEGAAPGALIQMERDLDQYCR